MINTLPKFKKKKKDEYHLELRHYYDMKNIFISYTSTLSRIRHKVSF